MPAPYGRPGGWIEYTGDIANKQDIYTIGNSPSEMQLLSEKKLNLLLLDTQFDKKIRFLTVLNQPTLAAEKALATPISISRENIGGYRKISEAYFKEILDYNKITIKYIGTDTVEEMKLILHIWQKQLYYFAYSVHHG